MSSTRSQLLTIRNQKILSGNSDTTAQHLREYEGEFIGSAVNLIDDMNVNGGYLGIQSGRVNQAFINSATPGNYFLRDDGTWQPVGAGAITGTAGRITVTTGVVNIDNSYIGQSSITTVGQITAGTWSGRSAPRVVTDITKTVLSIAPATTDVHVLTAQSGTCNIDIKIIPPPLHESEVCLVITDNSTPAPLLFDPGTVRFGGVVDPGTTISNQTVYFRFKYNFTDTIWDCILCTDDAGSVAGITGTVPATVNQIVLSSGSADDIKTAPTFTIDDPGHLMSVNGGLFIGMLTSTIYGVQSNVLTLGLYGYGSATYILCNYDGTNFIHGFTGIDVTPTARLHIAAGTATAGTAPLKLAAGTLLSSIEDGAIEYGSSHLYVTIGLNRYQLDQQASALLAAVNAWSAANTFSAGITLNTVGLTITNVDVILGTGSGTKFGTSTSQKLAFFGSTPTTQPIATLELGTVLSNLGLRASGSAYDITTTGVVTLVTQSVGNNSTLAATTAFVLSNSTRMYGGTVSQVGTATTTFTVTIGATMANTNYRVPSPGALNVLSAAPCYITNKTTTTFDVVYLTGLTGTVAFDWNLYP